MVMIESPKEVDLAAEGASGVEIVRGGVAEQMAAPPVPPAPPAEEKKERRKKDKGEKKEKREKKDKGEGTESKEGEGDINK